MSEKYTKNINSEAYAGRCYDRSSNNDGVTKIKSSMIQGTRIVHFIERIKVSQLRLLSPIWENANFKYKNIK